MEEGSSKRWYYASLSLILILVIITSSLLALYFDLRLHNATLEKELENLEVQNSRLETKFETLQANLESELNIMRSMLGNMTPQYANESIALIGAKIYKIAEPSVVLITLEVLGGGVAQGSGFVYNVEGYIVTNNHVVEDAVDPNSLTVMFMNGTVTKAFVVGRDPYSDLAVIKVDLPSEMLKPLPIGNSSALRVGEPVFAVGNPFGLSGTITSGIVSQLGRTLEAPGGYRIINVIQTDAAINPGNSGGPLLNIYGEVVGVNTAIASTTGSFTGIGFAVSSDLMKRVVPSLIEKGHYDHPWVGIVGTDVTPEIANEMGLNESTGLLIKEVVGGSPADKAGLRDGDVIVGVDDHPVRRFEDLVTYTEMEKSVGDPITLTIIRDKTRMEVNLTLGARPPP